MSHPPLYRQLVPLDSQAHRNLRLKPADDDFAAAASMHMVYVSTDEIPMASLDYVVVFCEFGITPPGERPQVIPMALLGAQRDENLYLEGGRWTGRYLPAFVRRYPFFTSEGAKPGDPPLVMVDTASARVSETEGAPLFDEQGKPTPVLNDVIGFLGMFEHEVGLTRDFCAVVQRHDLLKQMVAQMKMPDGEELSITGFYMPDQDKLRALAAATKLELLANGTLSLLQGMQMSLGNLRYLTERKARRGGKSQLTGPV